MSSVAAAMLLLGACGSASRTIVVEPSIERIVLQCVVGGVSDVLHSGLDRQRLRLRNLSLPSLHIDGQPRTGAFAWLAAAGRVAGYALDRRTSGSVEYAYRLRVRGFVVERRTRITDGSVVLTTDVYGSIGPRGELHHVRLVLDAREMGDRTRIRGTATGWSRIGDRCRLVGRIASRVIADELDDKLLGRIQRGGIDLYRAGSIAEVLR